MGRNQKLLLAGLAVGVTAYMLWKMSKDKKNHSQPNALGYYPDPSHSNPSHSGDSHKWGKFGAAAGLLGAGAGVAAYSAHQNHSSSTGGATYDVPWSALKDWKHISHLLAQAVMDQHLYPFYPNFDSIVPIAKRIAQSGALVDCADSWKLPPQLAQDLVKLALFDVCFLLDDSASMRSEGTRRRDALREILKRAADAATRFDKDGIEVRWMNATYRATTIHNVNEATRTVDDCKWDGPCTPMGGALEEQILNELVYPKVDQGRLAKPVLIIIVTDGRPTGHSEKSDRILRAVTGAKHRLANSVGEDAVSFSIAAVGNDREAQEFLDHIDSNPTVGDLVDVTSDIQTEAAQVRRATGIELTSDLHCLKILLGAIDSSYDQSDEPPTGRQTDKARKRQEIEARFASQKQAFEAGQHHSLSREVAATSAGPMAGADPSQYGGAAPYGAQAGGYPQIGGYPASYPTQPGGYPSQPAGYPAQGGSSPYPQPSQAAGYPPAPDQYGGAYGGSSSPFPPQNPAYPSHGAASSAPYPPSGGGFPSAPGSSPYPPQSGAPYGAPPAYGAPPQGSGDFGGGFVMPTPQHGGGSPQPPHQQPQMGAPGWPSAPGFPSAPSGGNW